MPVASGNRTRTEVAGMAGLHIPAAVEWACEGGLLYVRLSGEIDAGLESDLSELIGGAAGCFRRALVDLHQVTFFGVAGLNFLARLAGSGGTVQLIGLPDHQPIRRQVYAAGLDDVIVVECPKPRSAGGGPRGTPAGRITW